MMVKGPHKAGAAAIRAGNNIRRQPDCPLDDGPPYIPDTTTGSDRRPLCSAKLHAFRLAFGVTDIQPQSGGSLASEACLYP